MTQFRLKKLAWPEPLSPEPSYQPYMFLLHKNSIEKTGLEQMLANSNEEFVTVVSGYVPIPKFTELCVLHIDNAL